MNRLWTVIHWVIIVNFLLEVFYGSYMVFFVIGEGGGLPLFGRASTMPYETLMLRRQYAIETWIAISGLSVYLAITEILPRRVRERGA